MNEEDVVFLEIARRHRHFGEHDWPGFECVQGRNDVEMSRGAMSHEAKVALFTRHMVSVGASVGEIDAHLARVYGHACGSAHLPADGMPPKEPASREAGPSTGLRGSA